MAGQTSIRKLPFAQAGEPLQQFPAVSQALAEALDSTLFPPATGKNANDSFASYPLGLSVMGLTSAIAAAGGWPAGSWQLLTVRRAGNDQASQLLMESSSTGNAEVRYRSGNVNGWAPWFQVTSRNTARAMHAGFYQFNTGTGDSTRAVAFPSGTFTTPPIVVCQCSSSDSLMVPTAITANGFNLNMRPFSGAGNVSRRGSWIALETNALNA